MENSIPTADWELVTAQPAGGVVEGGEIWRVKVSGGWIYRWSHSRLGEHICFREDAVRAVEVKPGIYTDLDGSQFEIEVTQTSFTTTLEDKRNQEASRAGRGGRDPGL